jgi:hypothetical protein
MWDSERIEIRLVMIKDGFFTKEEGGNTFQNCKQDADEKTWMLLIICK